jgi:hypothetical protein
MSAVYRIQQGLRALFAFTQPVDSDLAQQYLSPELMTCFRAMRRGEQLHSLHILRTILAQGSTPDDLAVAALLHDAGKSRYGFPVWQKTLVVLIRAFAPHLYKHLSEGDETNPIHRPFVLSQHHPAWSATLVNQAGASERAIWLIEHHADGLEQWQNHPHIELLQRLKAADDAH